LKLYATSVVILFEETLEVEHHLFTFSVRTGAETTPEQTAAELAKPLLPKESKYSCQVKTVSVDFHKHFESYINEEFQDITSKEA